MGTEHPGEREEELDLGQAERGRARVPVPPPALDAILAKVAPGPTAADA
jgi:hypothetical protein